MGRPAAAAPFAPRLRWLRRALALALLAAGAYGEAGCAASAARGGGVCDERRQAGEGFFRGYGTAWVQAEMLRDEVRTRAFRDAILSNRAVFEGKVVLDVGTGTGILACFAAQAGAARVFAVEGSDMALIAKQIVADNGLAEQVEVIHGLLEDIELPVQQVDIIISEWIGTFLVHEAMLDSVLLARDRWLAPGGLMVPDSAVLYLAAVEDQGADLDSWKDFHGLDFSSLAAASRRVAAQQCAFRRSTATEAAPILELDLYTAVSSQQEFSRGFVLPALADAREREAHAMLGWFTLGFFGPAGSRRLADAVPSTLTTHPDEQCTHWQQTMFHLEKPLPLAHGGAIAGSVEVRRALGSPRDLNVTFSLEGRPAESFVVVGAEL